MQRLVIEIWGTWRLVLVLLLLAVLLQFNGNVLYVYTAVIPGGNQLTQLCTTQDPSSCMGIADMLLNLRISMTASDFGYSLMALEASQMVQLTKVSIQGGMDYMMQVRMSIPPFLAALADVFGRIFKMRRHRS